MGPRWWNAGRYEHECAEFDAAQPLSRQVWESLERHRRGELSDYYVIARDSLLAREPPPDPWEEFAQRVYLSPWPCHYTPVAIFGV